MKAKLLGVMAAGVVLCAVPVLAHHSFSAEYDRAKPIELTGKVSKVEWMNPHARFYVNVKEDAACSAADCKVTNWEFELGSPNGLMRQGWTRNSLKEGDVVTVNGSRAKDGTNLVNATTVTLAGADGKPGKKVFAGSSAEDPATK